MIELNWTLLLQFVNFVVLLFILNLLLYRPLRRLMQERQQTVDGSYRKAREMEGEIATKMEHYQQRLQEAKRRGHQERTELRQGALTEENRLLVEARNTAAEQVQTIRTQVATETAGARQTLKKETQALAARVAGKVLGRSI